MRSTIKTAVTIAAMALLMSASFKSFSQTSKFSISLNSLTTNFNYGKSNSTLQSYKKNYQGLQAGFSYQAGISASFSIVPEIYFAKKGGILKMLKTRLLSFSLIISLGFIALVSLLINALIEVVMDRLQRFLPSETVILGYIINVAITLIAIGFLFSIIFKVLPDAKI